MVLKNILVILIKMVSVWRVSKVWCNRGEGCKQLQMEATGSIGSFSPGAGREGMESETWASETARRSAARSPPASAHPGGARGSGRPGASEDPVGGRLGQSGSRWSVELQRSRAWAATRCFGPSAPWAGPPAELSRPRLSLEIPTRG